MVKKNKKDKPMSMLDRWAMDEKMFPGNPLGLEKQNGPFTTYHPNGNKRCEGNCDDGTPIGKWTYYNDDGTIRKVEEY